MSTLRDSNLALVVGLCSREEPLCAISEAGDLGDLWTFLRGKEAVTSARRMPRPRTSKRRRSKSHYSNLEGEEGSKYGEEDTIDGSPLLLNDLDEKDIR